MGYTAMLVYVTAGSKKPSAGLLSYGDVGNTVLSGKVGETIKQLFAGKVTELRKGKFMYILSYDFRVLMIIITDPHNLSTIYHY